MDAMIYNRDLTGAPVGWRGLRPRVNSLEWTVTGGSRAASVTLFGNQDDLWEALQWLRCPLVVWDEWRRQCWSGYVNEVQVRVGAVEVRVGLATMTNKVAVRYSYVPPGGEMSGDRMTTAWAEDAGSQAEFGIKELLRSAAGMTPTAAEQLRDAVLAAQRYPQAVTEQSGSFGMSRGRLGYSGADESLSATLFGVGWWQTLGWEYASWGLVESVSYTSVTTTTRDVGYNTTTSSKVCQQVTPGTAVNALEVMIYAQKVGSPTDNLQVDLYATDANGDPTGSALASASVAGTGLTTSFAWYTLTLSAEVQLQAGVSYALVVSRSGSVSTSNYYQVNQNNNAGYSGGVMKFWTGSAWTALTADMPFRMYCNNQIATSEQIRYLAETYGQFFTNVIIGTASGVDQGSYRDGDTTALAEILELMKTGTTNDRRYMARVDAGRRLWVEEEPPSTDEVVYLDLNGMFGNLIGVEVPPQELPGRWCKLRDSIPLVNGCTTIINPGKQFIEGATWSNGSVQAQFRGQPGVEER